MNEFICKQNLLTIFKKGEIYNRTAEIDNNYPNIVQINHINFNLDKDESITIDSELADFMIWLKGEWGKQISVKGLYFNGTSGHMTPYVYDYFYATKELIKKNRRKWINL